MRRYTILFVLVIALASCATQQKTLEQVKADFDCIEYKEGIVWKKISEKFGNPDLAPLPERGTDLSKNTRVYKNMIVIFYTERKEVNEEGKIRFREVVTNIEVCNEK